MSWKPIGSTVQPWTVARKAVTSVTVAVCGSQRDKAWRGTAEAAEVLGNFGVLGAGGQPRGPTKVLSTLLLFWCALSHKSLQPGHRVH